MTTTQDKVTAGITQILPTGTGVQVQGTESRTLSIADLGKSNQHQLRLALTVTQALLRGSGVDDEPGQAAPGPH